MVEFKLFYDYNYNNCYNNVRIVLSNELKRVYTTQQKHAMCDKLMLCKQAYLCDMRLLHAVAGNFLATAVECHK